MGYFEGSIVGVSAGALERLQKAIKSAISGKLNR